jgi:anti-anti-sigma regulatory factor
MERPADPRLETRPEWIKPMPEPRMPTGDTGPHEAGGAASPAPTVGATDIASVGPSISIRQLEHDHALVVVRGAICVEFLLSVRQHLTNLVDVGVRYIVVDLAEVTACPPQMVGELAAACRALHAREGWLRSIASAPCVVTALESADVEELFPIYQAAHTEFRKVS